VAYLYHPTINHQSHNFRLFHFHPDSTALLVDLSSNIAEEIDQEQKISFQLECLFYKDYESKSAFDSIQLNKQIPLGDVIRLNSTYILKFKTPDLPSYLLSVHYWEPGSPFRTKDLIEIKRSDERNEQYFLLSKSKEGAMARPMNNNYINTIDSYEIRHMNDSITKLFVEFYKHSKNISYPSFIVTKAKPFSRKPDSSYSIVVNKPYRYNQEGIYIVKSDPISKHGLLLLNFENDYPQLTDTKQLIESVRYIVKGSEYRFMLRSKRSKSVIDSFWIERGGNMDRARVLIREYYSRVRSANLFFTSFKEGWKTDRGMIYIIHGKPDIIYKEERLESWIYEESITEPLLGFTFYKSDFPFSSNNYELFRNIHYENSWNIAVHKWRFGRVDEITKD